MKATAYNVDRYISSDSASAIKAERGAGLGCLCCIHPPVGSL